MYRPGSIPGPDTLVRSTTILDLNAMNVSEVRTYYAYVSEGFRENENRGLAGMTIGSVLIAMLAAFGAFYLYYSKKY